MVNDPLAETVRMFVLSMQAQRCQTFGWEDHMNDFSPEDKRRLAEHMPECRSALLLAAMECEK